MCFAFILPACMYKKCLKMDIHYLAFLFGKLGPGGTAASSRINVLFGANRGEKTGHI